MASGIVESSQSGSDQSPQQQQGQGISRGKLVQRLLAASANLPAFINDLLTTQAVHVAGTEAAAFIIEPSQEGGFNLKTIAHIRPDSSSAETRAAAIAAFQEIVRPCVEQQKDGAIQIGADDPTAEPQFCLVTLLRSDGNIVAVSAVIARCRDLERAKQRLESMALVAGYFELFTLRRTSEQSRTIAQSHQHVLQLASSVATADGFESAGMSLCNELATRTGATRVSLGWVYGNNIKLKAMSHTEQFDKKQEMSVMLVKVMEECWDNGEIVQFEPGGTHGTNVTREAEILSRTNGGETILSLPLRRKDEVVGVITLQFAPNTKIAPQAATGLAVAVDLLAPQLYDRFQNDRWLITKAGVSSREMAKLAVGPKHMLAKLIILAVLALIAFLAAYRPMYHVTAGFVFDPVQKVSFSAPFEGMLKTVNVKPGDVVKAGDVLAEFDATDSKLKQAQYMSEAAAARQAAQAALADPEKTALALQKQEEAKSAEAQAEFFRQQVEKAQLRAPFDGTILTGDLREKVHSVFKLGDPLMEMAERTNLRAELSVPERDIQDVKVGAKGMLATTSLPNDKYPFAVDRIVPLPEAKEGGNYFKVYGHFEKTSPNWRPGMAGEAKIDVAKKPLGWIWVHRFTEWVEIKWWQLW
jgi:multidrug resistance efflux pump